MSERGSMKDRVRDAIREAGDLPDGAWLEWIAERAGLGAGNGYMVAEIIGEDPAYFGFEWGEKATPPEAP